MINRKCWTAAICLGLMTLLGGHRLSAAAPEKKQSDDAKAKMEAEGWKEISKGVFERQLGPNKVEHLGFGPEGLSWTIGKLNRQLSHLREEYEKYPSEKLATIIDDLALTMAKSRLELRRMMMEEPSSRTVEGLSSITGAVTGGSCSSICYSATADAYEQTTVQGVGAVANASFNSSCGHSGETYAYAFARATLNGTTTTITQQDPDSGTSITSSASAVVNGGNAPGIPCYSEASSYAQSSALGISYSTSDSNSECDAPVCSVTINGTSYEYFYQPGCRTRTWTATLNGCSNPTYQWKINGTVVGTGSTYSRSICPSTASFNLQLTVNGVTDDHWVEVVYEYCECCSGQICP